MRKSLGLVFRPRDYLWIGKIFQQSSEKYPDNRRKNIPTIVGKIFRQSSEKNIEKPNSSGYNVNNINADNMNETEVF